MLQSTSENRRRFVSLYVTLASSGNILRSNYNTYVIVFSKQPKFVKLLCTEGHN